jgi:hypothetical protein
MDKELLWSNMGGLRSGEVEDGNLSVDPIQLDVS